MTHWHVALRMVCDTCQNDCHLDIVEYFREGQVLPLHKLMQCWVLDFDL